MQLFDPTTNTWYDYTPPAGTLPTGQSNYSKTGGVSTSYRPSSLTAISDGNAPTSLDGTSLLAPTGKAQEIAANLLSAQFKDWEQVYKPVELNLLQQSSLNNPEVLTNAVSDASTAANNTYDAMAGVKQRQLAAQGISETPQQQAVSSRMSNLSRAAAVAGGENTARRNVAYQDELIALGTAPNPNIVQQSNNSKYSSS